MRSESSDDPEVLSFTAAARRQQLTAAAIAVLAENGYAATSLATIAARVGVSKGVLSYHFSDKAQLLRQVVRTVLAHAEEWMAPRIEGAASYREALGRYIAANVSFLATHREEIAALTEVLANARVTEGVPELYARSRQEAEDALVALFAGGRETGEFGDVPPRILAMSLRATIDAASERLRADSAFDLGVFEGELTALFSRAVEPAVEREQVTR